MCLLYWGDQTWTQTSYKGIREGTHLPQPDSNTLSKAGCWSALSQGHIVSKMPLQLTKFKIVNKDFITF